ncbi:MAG TPA: M48 family metallopeptidase [Smithellaceae bacterium]|nr:M48 family metallopeptidase [Smithellaceae bacterium]
MEKAIFLVFIILFVGRAVWRYQLGRFNLLHLQQHGKIIPPVFQGVIDENTLRKMVAYTSDNTKLGEKESITGDILELAIVFLFLPCFIGTIIGWQLHCVLQALIFFGVLALISGVAGIPFNLYHTFVLEKKYGFSRITWRLWLTDLIKSIVISTILMGIIISVLMSFINYLPTSWWFWAWLFFVTFETVLLWLYPVAIAPLFNKFEPLKDEVLRERIINLMAKAGLQTKGVFQVDEGKRSKHTNAYFTGIGKTRRIVLYDTLLSSHTHDEILAVLAHEIGHWKKKHILKQLSFMIVLSLAVLYGVYCAVGSPVVYRAFGLSHTPVYAGLFLVSIGLGVISFFLSPIGAAVLRRYEREADRMAVDLTGTVEPLINALTRLAKDNLANLHPHPLYVLFYYSHPPLLERIENLRTMDYKSP